MTKILLLQDSGFLHSLSKDFTDSPFSRKVLFLEEPSKASCEWIQRNSFVSLPHPQFNEAEREVFLASYIDLIGQFSQKFNGHLWWATDLSSKNRFNSNLPHFLQQMVLIKKVFSAQSAASSDPAVGTLLMVVGVHWQVMDDLRFFFEGQGAECRIFKKTIKNNRLLWRTFVRRTGGLVLQFFANLYKSIKVKQVLGQLLRKKLSVYRSGTLIKTFIYNHSFLKDGEYHDAFFCDMVPYLEKKGPVFIFANILGDYESSLAKIAKARATIIPMEYLAGPLEIFQSHWQALTYRIKLKEQMRFADLPITRTVNNELRGTLCRIRPYQLLHFAYMRNLLKMIKVEQFITSFENNPWEKMCFLAFKQFSPSTTITGYQHTVVPQASVNMFISRYEKDIIPHPDRLLTVGEEPCRIIRKYSLVKCFPVAPACALRFKYLFDLPVQPRRQTKTILLGLEGIFDVYHMVNYVIKHLPPESGYKVILRTHPVLPVKDFEHKLSVPLKQLPHFEVSKGLSLKEDIQRCDAAIYWGSTVGLEALWIGRPVIHYDNGFVLSYDPLFECKSLKWVAKEGDSLLEILNKIYSLPESEFISLQRSARSYLENYFYPINTQALSLFTLTALKTSQNPH